MRKSKDEAIKYIQEASTCGTYNSKYIAGLDLENLNTIGKSLLEKIQRSNISKFRKSQICKQINSLLTILELLNILEKEIKLEGMNIIFNNSNLNYYTTIFENIYSYGVKIFHLMKKEKLISGDNNFLKRFVMTRNILTHFYDKDGLKDFYIFPSIGMGRGHFEIMEIESDKEVSTLIPFSPHQDIRNLFQELNSEIDL